jgi:putative polyhydroxyalkanoate system protein
MPKYQVDIPHSLSTAAAKERIGGATGKLEKDYGATCVWQGDDVLMVSRKGLEAKVTIEPSRVHVDLNLGFLLTPLAGAITAGITKELSGILASAAPAQP